MSTTVHLQKISRGLASLLITSSYQSQLIANVGDPAEMASSVRPDVRGCIEKLRSNVAWITSVFVGSRGRNKGIGSALLLAGFECMVDLWVKHVFIAAIADDHRYQKRLVKFYENHGFQSGLVCSGRPVDKRVMVKVL